MCIPSFVPPYLVPSPASAFISPYSARSTARDSDQGQKLTSIWGGGRVKWGEEQMVEWNEEIFLDEDGPRGSLGV